MAQTNVQIYGIVDSGIAHLTNVNACRRLDHQDARR
jgi:predicted porin